MREAWEESSETWNVVLPSISGLTIRNTKIYIDATKIEVYIQ